MKEEIPTLPPRIMNEPSDATTINSEVKIVTARHKNEKKQNHYDKQTADGYEEKERLLPIDASDAISLELHRIMLLVTVILQCFFSCINHANICFI